MDTVRKRHGLDKINLMGICMGGSFCVMYAALHPRKIKNLVTTVTPTNFDTDAGLLHVWTRDMDVDALVDRCDKAMKDDMNTPVLIGHLFEGVKWIHGLAEKKLSITLKDLEQLRTLFYTYVFEVLGLANPEKEASGDSLTDPLMEMILKLRTEAKSRRDFETADRIRQGLASLGITLKDRKDGVDWEIN